MTPTGGEGQWEGRGGQWERQWEGQWKGRGGAVGGAGEGQAGRKHETSGSTT